MILEKIQSEFGEEILEVESASVIVARKDRSYELLAFLRDNPQLKFEFLMDLCGVDYSVMGKKPRFAVVYHLYSLTHNHRLRLKVAVPEEDSSVRSVVDLWHAADWLERECAEMFGIRFDGHPRPGKLLLFEGFEGHPLRKDYPIARRQRIPVTEEKLF